MYWAGRLCETDVGVSTRDMYRGECDAALLSIYIFEQEFTLFMFVYVWEVSSYNWFIVLIQILFYNNRILLLLTFFLSLKSAVVDRFWCSRCLKDCINLPNEIGSFSSGTITPMVVKNEKMGS